MRKFKTLSVASVAVIALSSALAASPVAIAGDTLPNEKQCKKAKPAEHAGWCAAIIRQKGNCLACHKVIVQGWPSGLADSGNIGPPLIAMKSRFPSRAKLHARVWDATAVNPHSMMPPFGRSKLMSEKDIDAVVDWLLTL